MSIYKCPVCGRSYSTIDGVRNCTNSCAEREEKLKRAKLAEELKAQARKQKIDTLTASAAAKRREIERVRKSLEALAKEYNDTAEKLYNEEKVLLAPCLADFTFATQEEVKAAEDIFKSLKEALAGVGVALDGVGKTCVKSDTPSYAGKSDFETFLRENLGF